MSPHRRRDRIREKNIDHDGAQSVAAEPTGAIPPRPSVVVVATVVADPFRVQPADLTRCQVAGCAEQAIPEMWEVVNLDTGDELPVRLCEEHQLAYLRSRPASLRLR